MSFTFTTPLLTLAILVSPLTAHAILASPNLTPPRQDVETSALIERGGTVDSYDAAKRILIVDKVKFSLPFSPVVIHPPVNSKVGNTPFALKPNMKIKFTTSKANQLAQNQVREIWVTNLPGPVLKK